jgi:hypothetical protein
VVAFTYHKIIIYHVLSNITTGYAFHYHQQHHQKSEFGVTAINGRASVASETGQPCVCRAPPSGGFNRDS